MEFRLGTDGARWLVPQWSTFVEPRLRSSLREHRLESLVVEYFRHRYCAFTPLRVTPLGGSPVHRVLLVLRRRVPGHVLWRSAPVVEPFYKRSVRFRTFRRYAAKNLLRSSGQLWLHRLH